MLTSAISTFWWRSTGTMYQWNRAPSWSTYASGQLCDGSTHADSLTPCSNAALLSSMPLSPHQGSHREKLPYHVAYATLSVWWVDRCTINVTLSVYLEWPGNSSSAKFELALGPAVGDTCRVLYRLSQQGTEMMVIPLFPLAA